jgi:adenylylsulfate kinase-like enzyme
MIITLFGQPCSGKTTLARHIQAWLEETGYTSNVIDGDKLRDITENHDYSVAGRDLNHKNAAIVARYLKYENVVDCVIIAMVLPFRNLREEMAGKTNMVSFYLHTSEIREREANKVKNFDVPTPNEAIYINTDKSIESCLNTIKSELIKRGF